MMFELTNSDNEFMGTYTPNAFAEYLRSVMDDLISDDIKFSDNLSTFLEQIGVIVKIV